MTDTSTTTSPDTTEPAAVNLDAVAGYIDKYEALKEQISELTEEAERTKKTIAILMGDATEGLVAGKVHVTYRPTGKFMAERFTREHPELAQQLTRTVTRDELDTEKLKADFPQLFAAYRTRRFLVA